jgi:hypothetical protein
MKTTTETLTTISQQIGIVLMTAAATVGMLELPDHLGAKVVVPNQPAFAFASESTEGANPLRREREESAPHYISYSVSQRTPGRYGKR